jgi:riboflavin synthase
MFTGIIEITGKVKALQLRTGGALIDVTAGFKDLALGESIAVNGACLTVARINKEGFSADLSPETAARTTLGKLKTGRIVNLERALKLGDRLGGHMVSGHIDCTARVERLIKRSGGWLLTVSLEGKHLKYIVDQGSVAVEGISLTVSRKLTTGFETAIIPHTYNNTNLKELKTGDRVNLELDMNAKYLESLIKANR